MRNKLNNPKDAIEFSINIPKRYKVNFEKVNNTSKVETLKEQASYIKKFLPSMLSEEKIKEIIESLDDKSMPGIMRHFKANYAGKCDMSVVSRLAKQCQG